MLEFSDQEFITTIIHVLRGKRDSRQEQMGNVRGERWKS